MTRIFATTRKTLQLDVVGPTVIVRRNGARARRRTFRNRYTLRKYLTAQVEAAQAAGFVSVNR